MIQRNNMTFSSCWWSVELPPEWVAMDDDQCVTLSGKRFPSALQISAARKEHDTITDADLIDFASDRIATESQLRRVDLNEFSGFYVEHVENGVFWREWWLRAGCLMIYVCYNVDEKFKKSELVLVDRIVKSLKAN